MFGRILADSPDDTCDAAMQVAHAFVKHRSKGQDDIGFRLWSDADPPRLTWPKCPKILMAGNLSGFSRCIRKADPGTGINPVPFLRSNSFVKSVACRKTVRRPRGDLRKTASTTRYFRRYWGGTEG
ncbi:type I-E CRISPR-associated protein Cas7/Cse4/CasC [Primorskyibacter sp. 2E107]|uniref:type I-E CRISPR-associated protein Cas7/Cse4/CasC n=1 Tax=Primorskyibacter sp. 2E107 TaxID=3403458 RepID=UPI003AFA00EE